MPELRKDPLSGRWVVISAERASRPGSTKFSNEEKKGGFCPFCVGNEHTTPPEVYALRDSPEKNGPGWKLRVVPNKFPALASEGCDGFQKDGVYEKMAGVGAHEVVIENPDHRKEIAMLSAEELGEVIKAYRQRLLHYKKEARIKYVQVFKNKGAVSGGSLDHPHTQLIAMPLVPKAVAEELDNSKSYHEKNGKCLICSIIDYDIRDKKRIVAEDENFVAICPYAPRFQYETWVLPKKHESNFEEMDDKKIKAFANFFGSILKKIHDVLGDPPYNFMLHTAPVKESGLPHYHWHIEIAPLLSPIAGFERGTDSYINPVPPEFAAEKLRAE